MALNTVTNKFLTGKEIQGQRTKATQRVCSNPVKVKNRRKTIKKKKKNLYFCNCLHTTTINANYGKCLMALF